MERLEVVLRPVPIVGFAVAVLAFGFSIVFLYRHDYWFEWALGFALIAGSLGFVVACRWRHFTVVTTEGLLRVDWFGFRRRFIPVSGMTIESHDRDTSYGLLPPDLEVRFCSSQYAIGLMTHLYFEHAVRDALALLQNQGVGVPARLRDKLKLPSRSPR